MERVNSQNRLEDLVGGLNQRKNKYLLLKGLSRIAIVFFISAAIATILSLFSSNSLYYGFLKSLVLLVTALAIAKEVVLPIIKKPHANDLYKKLDYISHSLGEDTISAIELEKNIKDSSLLGTSKELALAHIDKTSQRLQSLDPTFIYPLNNLKNNFILTIAGLIIVSLAAIFIPGNFKNYLFSLNIAPSVNETGLKLADIEITINYPDYTKLPPNKIKSTKGDIEAIKGAKLIFQAVPTGSFEKGSLVVKGGISVPVVKKRWKNPGGIHSTREW